MEHFHFWGAEKQLRAARTIPPDYGIGGLTAYGTLLGEHAYDWLQRDLVKPYYYTANERLPQYATEAVLRQRAAELPSVETLYGWGAETIEQDDGGVTISVAERGGESRRTVRAAYAVGCDGSRSLVREQSGITQTRTDHDRMMVLLVFRSHELHELLDERYPGKSFYNVLQPELKGYWKFFGRVDLGSTWFFHAPVPPGTDERQLRLPRLPARGRRRRPSTSSSSTSASGTCASRSPTRTATGRVFIAGDAAHSHPPYGGYGINSGLEDARNLGWKLAAVLQGWGGEALLDSYDAERRPVFESTMRDFIAKSIETGPRLPRRVRSRSATRRPSSRPGRRAPQGAVGEVHAFEPNYEGSPVVCRPATRGAPRVSSALGSHRFEARAGHHLAPAALPAGGNVFDALGPGFTLLAFGADAQAVQAFRDAAAALDAAARRRRGAVRGRGGALRRAAGAGAAGPFRGLGRAGGRNHAAGRARGARRGAGRRGPLRRSRAGAAARAACPSRRPSDAQVTRQRLAARHLGGGALQHHLALLQHQRAVGLRPAPCGSRGRRSAWRCRWRGSRRSRARSRPRSAAPGLRWPRRG